MSFKISDYIISIATVLSAPNILENGEDTAMAIAAANSFLSEIYNQPTHIFTILKKQGTLTSIANTNNILLTGITDYGKIIDLYYDEIKSENKLFQISPNFLTKISDENIEYEDDYFDDIVSDNNYRPRHYTTEYLPNYIYFDGEFSTEENLIIIYKKKLTKLTSYSDDIELSADFEPAFYDAMIEFLIQPTKNLNKFNIEYWRLNKIDKINAIIQKEISAPIKKTGTNINKQLSDLSNMSKIW